VTHCYIVTEFCNEGDLSSFLKKKRRASEQEVLKFMKDIISGFIEMAEKCYLHRDLKLANIFLSDGRAIIADFGFAKKHS
jgi:serine/threonine protein kinase